VWVKIFVVVDVCLGFTERQQIRVSVALVAVAHSALYVADTDFGIGYHALAVSSVRLVHPDVQHFNSSTTVFYSLVRDLSMSSFCRTSNHKTGRVPNDSGTVRTIITRSLHVPFEFRFG
jgi:hypothetical protein